MKREFINRNDKEEINSDYDFLEGRIKIAGFDSNCKASDIANPASTGDSHDDSCTGSDYELMRRIMKVKNNTEYYDFNCVRPEDGSPESLMLVEAYEDIDPDEETKLKRKYRTELNCFNNDDSETRLKKTNAIEKFYKDEEQVEKVTTMLRGIFNELFEEMNLDETPEDEMQNAAELFLTKRPWAVNKYPEYSKQLIYVIKFNVIPNMLNKYFGRKKKNITDDEIQMRNYFGKGLRDAPRERNVFRKEPIPEFDVDADNGKLIYYFEEKEAEKRIDRASYESQKESFEKERRNKVARDIISEADLAVLKKKDDEIEVLWEILKNSNDYGKIDLVAAKKMNKTPGEIKTIKRRLTRYLRKKIKLNINESMKEEYEEKLALKSR